MLKALIFDVDGTLADTESAHRAAFNQAFAEMGMDWHWDEALYTRLLHISGGKERIAHYWNEVNPDLREIGGMALQETVNRLHELKTAAYSEAVQGGAVKLRPGVLSLMSQAHAQGLQLAIATTTSPVNISALLRRALGADWRLNFSAIGDAYTAPIKNRTRRCTCKCWMPCTFRRKPVSPLRIRLTDCRPRARQGSLR